MAHRSDGFRFSIGDRISTLIDSWLQFPLVLIIRSWFLSLKPNSYCVDPTSFVAKSQFLRAFHPNLVAKHTSTLFDQLKGKLLRTVYVPRSNWTPARTVRKPGILSGASTTFPATRSFAGRSLILRSAIQAILLRGWVGSWGIRVPKLWDVLGNTDSQFMRS